MESVPYRKIRQVGFSIKAYPRPYRETQQIYINGKYFMSFPSRVETGDPDNIIGSQAIDLITYLYERGVNLNQIKKELDRVVNKNIKRRIVSPRLKLERRQRQLQELERQYNKLRGY